MFKEFMPLPWWRQRQIGPQYYDLSCPACDFTDQVELVKTPATHSVIGETDADTRHSVRVLPATCPRCAARLKRTKVPIKIYY